MDATIVRTIMVPASMRLLGDWNWYLPRWLQWLPKLRVEGAAEDVVEERTPPTELPEVVIPRSREPLER
jgi:hypothetical protein